MLPDLTPEGLANARQFLGANGTRQAPPLRNPQDIENATQFFSDGGKIGLKGGMWHNDGPSIPERGRGIPISPEEKSRIADYIRQNQDKSDGEIAARFNVSPGSVNRIRAASGLSKAFGQGVAMAPAKKAEITDYIRQNPGKSDTEIGARFNVSGGSVNRIRAAIGLSKTSGRGIAATPAKRAEISDYIRQNPDESDNSIARHLNVSASTVRSVRESGLQRKAPNAGIPMSPAKRAEISDYIRQNRNDSDTSIARRFNVSPSIVSTIRYASGAPKMCSPGFPMSPANRAAIVDYIRQHPRETDSMIAGRFNVAGQTINRIRHEIGLQKQ